MNVFTLIFPIFLITGNLNVSINVSQKDSTGIIEKVYLHTDRVSYYPGEDIWFRAYLEDASARKLRTGSTNLHVELISPDARIIDSRTVKITEGLGNGDFRLPDTLRSGTYIVRAYTNYMRNYGNKLFFTKDITLINPSDTARITNEKDNPGIIKPELGFFPEGGALVDNITSTVAFKGEDSKGNWIDVEGEIFSASGGRITEFKSTNRGMGTFQLTPSPDTVYYAVVSDRKGEKFRFDIPESFATGVNMSVLKNLPGELILSFRTNQVSLPQVLNRDFSISISDRFESLKNYSFRMKSMNSFLNVPTADLNDGIYLLTLSTGNDTLPLCERMVYISDTNDVRLVVDTDKKLFSKRDSVTVNVTSTGNSAIDSTVFFSLSAADEMFSESSSSYPTDISSWFLLESDIRGKVADPSYYFDPSNDNRLRDLDILLLTQGWRDFKWKYNDSEFPSENGFTLSGRLRRLLSDKPIPGSEVNIGFFTRKKPLFITVPADSSGRFKVVGIDLTGEARVMASAVTNKNELKGWILHDSIYYSPAEITNEINHKAITHSNYKFTKSEQYPPETKPGNANTKRFIQYVEIKKSLEKQYKLSDTIQLLEVKVTAKRVDWTDDPKSESSHYLMGTPDKELVITPQLQKYANVVQLLESSMIISPIKVDPRISRNMQNPLFMIDGNRVSLSEVRSLPVSMVERIDVLDNMASFAVFGYRVVEDTNPSDSTGGGRNLDGVVSIILKKGVTDNRKPVFHSVNFSFKGFDEPRIFYSPRHNTTLEKDYKPDLRITLFWQPDARIEKDKKLSLTYFNGDNPGLIRITAEGITSSGIPVSATTEYEVR